MTTESKKLQTTLDSETPGLFSIALSGDPEEGLLERAEPEELEHDARLAHDMLPVLRNLRDAAFRDLRECSYQSRATLNAAIATAAPFLED